MVNRLIVAAAGSGKTTYLIEQALKSNGQTLITTFTIDNESEIKKRIIECYVAIKVIGFIYYPS